MQTEDNSDLWFSRSKESEILAQSDIRNITSN